VESAMKTSRAWTLAGILGLTLWIGLAAGCAEKRKQSLDPRDEPLLEQLRELAEIRILAQEDPDSAQARLDSFLAHTDTTAIHEHLAEVEADPIRGRFLLKALHDSLLVPHQKSARSPSASPPGLQP